MMVLKFKLAAVAAISLLSLSFEAAPAAAGGFWENGCCGAVMVQPAPVYASCGCGTTGYGLGYGGYGGGYRAGNYGGYGGAYAPVYSGGYDGGYDGGYAPGYYGGYGGGLYRGGVYRGAAYRGYRGGHLSWGRL